MKFKIFSFKSIVTYLTIVSFYIATTLSAFAAPLPPISLAQMYSLASQGNVRALRAAVQRGMNIDATDRYGNTGLCHSIYQNNYTAYNAFHASGANPRHPCIQNIPPQQYDYFMASSRATPVTATPRDAYKEFADGEFVFSTTTWVIGGLLLAGGIAAIALSGGGGGKKHHYYFPPNDSFTPTDDSLGAFVGTETPSAPENSPYTPVKITNGENDSNFTLSNDSQIKVGDETKNLVDVINLNDSVLDYTKYIQVGMKAIDGNQVVNGKIPLTGTEVGATITLQNNTAGMVALHNSNAINNNTLKIIARNGTLGMIASDKSLVRNNGNIDIAFQGTTATDQVDGMYADTSSTAINDGKITGNAAVDSVAGTLIGMQGRLINQVQNPAGTIPTQLINNGNISLSAAATPDKTISTSLVGMGSFLEKAFLEGTKLLRRTGFIEITNAANGVIDLNVNLGDSGTYDSTQSNLLNGTGGIVGIRSDAHTTATNNGAIRLTIAPESTNNITNSHAGMLSVHGGTIVNNKEITVTGGIGGYGMLGVRGEGTNSEFNTLNPTIVNSESGTISVNSTDGFGMATRHGGTVVNKGTIKMLAKGTGLQINAGTGTNSGTITLSNGGDGMTIRQNVTTEAGTANNASSAKIQNTETGVIDIKYANGSNGMFIEDGTAENNGSIKINGTDSTTTEASYGIHAQNGTMLNTGSIDMDVILSGDADSYGMYGENSASATNAATGKITFTRKGTGMYTTQGTNTNHGQIVMNGIGSTGMASESGAVLNGKTGSIQLVSGTGIKSTSGSVTNQGSINISQGEDSVGISSGSNAVNDKDATIQITGANSTGISVEENATAVNRGTITLTSTQNSKENYGMISAGGERAQIDNDGIINLNGYDYAASKEVGYGMSIGDGRANNNNTININRMYGYGMASTEGTLTNNGTINLTNGGRGIMGESGESFNNKDATITITGTPNMQNSYGMSMQDGTAKNFGQIDVTGGSVDSKTYGISVNGGNGLNHGLINMHSDNAFGLFDEGDGEITNVAGGTINLYGNNSVGMQTTSGKAENFGTINIGVDNGTGAIVGGSGSTGMIAGDGATAINSGHINMNGNNAVGMTANGGTVINDKSGTITLNGSGSAINSSISATSPAETSNTINNNGVITITGNGNGIWADTATITNAAGARIEVGGSGYGIRASKGSITNSGTITVSGSNGTGMSGGGTLVNDKTITASGSGSKGMEVTTGGTGTNNKDITASGSNSSGIYVNGGTADNIGTIISSGNGSSGIYAANGEAYNQTTISVAGEGSIGMTAGSGTVTNGKTVQVPVLDEDGEPVLGDDDQPKYEEKDLPGTINVVGSNAAGMKLAGSGKVINNKGATINVSGAGSTGIWAAGSGSAVNNGTINVSAADTAASGMRASTGTATNNAAITVTGNGAQGMYADGGNVVNAASGTIDLKAENTVGIYVANGSGSNLGTINLGGTGAIGLQADGGTATNSGSLKVSGTDTVGLYANGGTVVNSGTIEFSSGDAAVLVDDGIGRNDKTITVTSSNLEAMRADGGEAVNASGGTITLNSSANNSTAMYATRGKITNNGTIALNGNSGIGMMTEAEGTANNTGTINVSGADSVGILADGGTATNSSGTINVTGSSSFGMKATEGEAINNATINANNNIGMFADGGIVTNGSSGKINAGSGASYLMLAENGGTANNKGTLTFSGSGSALQAKGATVNNTGSITATGSGNGMAADGTSSAGANAVNSGTITVNSGKGMIATSTTIDTTVTNASGGVITVNSNGGVGMYADGSHARAINLGTINIKGTSSTSYGMKAVNGGSVENAGTINMAAGSAGTGIYVDGKSTFYNNASGKIVFAGGQTQSGTITGDTSAGSVDICDDGGSCANKFIHLEQGATLQNSGTMVTSASFKLNEMGGGRVLLASTGTMVAGNEISGDLYAVSDRAMLEQGQKDVYVNRNALTASEIDVNLMSASPMWEVSLVDSAEDSADDAAAQAEDEPAVEQPTVKDEDEADNDSSTSDKPSSEKDIVYNRVAFSNLVNNASQAAYLESNYAIRNTIYDGMITAGSMEEFNQALYSNLGLDLIPNFAKQNMDILRNVNRQVNSAVFNNNDTKEFRVHVGYDYFEREQDGTNGLSGYEDEAHTGYALFDKKYNANFRYGLGASFTKYSSDYDNGAERDEVIAQIMAPLIFETDSTKVVSMPRIGMGWGEYTRYDHTGEYKADTRNYYYGITNEARHELDMGLLTLEPVAEFNIIGLYQGRTKENIRVDSGNNLSVEGGLGLYAKKSFKPMGDDELNIRLGGTYYHEFNNPYQAVSAGIVGLQGRYHMNSYETQRNRAVLSSRFDYKRGKFNFYLEGSRFIEDDSTYSVNAGLTYAF